MDNQQETYLIILLGSSETTRESRLIYGMI